MRSPLVWLADQDPNVHASRDMYSKASMNDGETEIKRGHRSVDSIRISALARRDLGSIQKIEVPQEFYACTFREFFHRMSHEYGIVPIALYRGVDLHDNDNKLPYVYTCPSPDAPIMDGDSAFVLVQPCEISRKTFSHKASRGTFRSERFHPTESRGGSKSQNTKGRTHKSRRLRRRSIIE